jgi:RecB family endonuclease NucS
VPGSHDFHIGWSADLIRLLTPLHADVAWVAVELVANAWDADATTVSMQLPHQAPITPHSEIVVQDDGVGMTPGQVQEAYLTIGQNRRRRWDEDRSALGRPVIGWRGIGKLAAFSIARLLDVWTVRDGHMTAFRIDLDALRDEDAVHSAPILANRRVSPGDPVQLGTLIRLRGLRCPEISAVRVRSELGQRLALWDDPSFLVTVNGDPVHSHVPELQVRCPSSGLEHTDLSGFGPIWWWMGCAPRPLHGQPGGAGVAVAARGRIIQPPFFFGMAGQVGLGYLTGVVHADALDEHENLIAARALSWDDPRLAPLLAWGQTTVREVLRQWAARRYQDKKARLLDSAPFADAAAIIDGLPEREARELTAALDSLARVHGLPEPRVRKLATIIMRAFERNTEPLKTAIEALTTAGPQAQRELVGLVERWDLLDTLTVARRVRERVEVIDTFGALIRSKAPEKPHLQDFIVRHPWLLNPRWELLQHERSLDRILTEQFNLQPSGDVEGGRRLDFFCLGDASSAVVVELKRPGTTVGQKQLAQLARYVDFLRRWARETSGTHRQIHRVLGCLVCSKVHPDAEGERNRLVRDGMDILTWGQLRETAERLNRDFLNAAGRSQESG